MGRYSVYLLSWYKCTNTDAAGGAGDAASHRCSDERLLAALSLLVQSTNTDAKLLLLQATQPLGDEKMRVLAELVAYMKLLPSQAMKIDFYVDKGTQFTCFCWYKLRYSVYLLYW
jgi:hypothetical protein